MKRVTRNLLCVAAWLIAVILALNFLGDWLAPDGCLDFGGSFDYETWECSYTEGWHPYVEVWFYQFLSFWAFVTAGTLALIATAWRKRCRDAAQGGPPAT